MNDSKNKMHYDLRKICDQDNEVGYTNDSSNVYSSEINHNRNDDTTSSDKLYSGNL